MKIAVLGTGMAGTVIASKLVALGPPGDDGVADRGQRQFGRMAAAFGLTTACTPPCRRYKEPATRPSALKAQLRPYPFGEAADCVICFGGAASHHLEAMQHLGKDIEPDFDTRSPGSLGKHPAVIDKGLVASGLQVDRRESS